MTLYTKCHSPFRGISCMAQVLFHIRTNHSHSSNKYARKRVVLISSSSSIYDNLALEEWMYEKTDLSETDYLLLWRNRPTIVFGRHQNPWVEANIPQAVTDGVDIARRSSGGGTVYHDEGNLNLSFLKARHQYNRSENLNLVVKALTQRWNVDLFVNTRDDIMLDRIYKVSGTAAKLGRLQSYHHFTLLHNINQQRLQQYLDSPMIGVDSKATKSFPATVRNLKESAPDMTFELLLEVIGQQFLQETGQEIQSETFHVVDPLNDTEYPGVSDSVEKLKSWDWVYGKTPKFTISRSFVGQTLDQKTHTVNISIQVEKGVIVSINVTSEETQLQDVSTVLSAFYADYVKNFKLMKDNVSKLNENCENYIENNSGDENTHLVSKWIVKCVDSCFHFL